MFWMRRWQKQMALRDGLLLASQVGCSKLIVNSDCVEVMEAIQRAAAVIYEGFAHVVFSHSHSDRESNRVAHFLACKAEGPHSVWIEDPPNFILGLLANDVTLFDD
jgi:hypothetical protein